MTNFLFFKSKHIKRLGFSILMLLFCAGANAQMTVSGKVTDSSGPVPGVNVTLKGTSTGAATDFDGNYTISNVPSNGVLVFSYLGYKSQEVSINNQNQINVALESDMAALDEVVVIGYGTQKKESVTGSMVSVKGEDLGQANLYALRIVHLHVRVQSGTQIKGIDGVHGTWLASKLEIINIAQRPKRNAAQLLC